jgi:hypothetical protein
MKIEFVGREAVDRLLKQIPANIAVYREGQSADLIRKADRRESKIAVNDPPVLVKPNGEIENDAAATRLIYQWLSRLDPTQAGDERLWVFLTHVTFSDYTHRRWLAGLTRAESPQDVVEERWFFRGEGLRTKVHNALSRLWWFAHLTYDAQRSDPFELTDTLLSLQDLQTAFVERSIGACRPLLVAALEAYRRRDLLADVPRRGPIIREWAKALRLHGGAFLLDAIPQKRLENVASSRLRNAIEGR